MLQDIHSPQDLKRLPEKQLPRLASEIRQRIISVVGKNGGHLASNLGVVELTIALHRVFDSPRDAIVWDVSHQSYAHKILTGRSDRFATLRTEGGISGFTRINESPHDFFDAGHASSSISSALGLLTAWNHGGRTDKVVAVIGDGALTGGMAFEALSHAGLVSKNLIIVLNDNQMSISRNTGAISSYLSRLTMGSAYQKIRFRIDRLVDGIPYINRHLGKLVYRLKRGLKGLLLTNNLFVDLGFEYVGPLNGHNIHELETVFRRVKKLPRPVVVHVVTKKGKGYSPAENDPSTFHGVGPFNISDGVVEKYDVPSFTQAFSTAMVSLARKNGRLAAITAAMSKGTGLDAFSRHFKDRFFDVGIAEEHAVTFAGGLAAGGMVPVVAIYSTFIQRSIDQIIEDVALPNRHVVFAVDRAGAVADDGETHQGMFDIALFRAVPNLAVLTVVSGADLAVCLDWAVNVHTGPVALRYPKLTCPSELPEFSDPVKEGVGILLSAESYAPAVASRLLDEYEAGAPDGTSAMPGLKKLLLVCTGSMYSETLTAARSLLLSGVLVDIYVLRFIKPFDGAYFADVCAGYDGLVFVEDGVRIGGISMELSPLVPVPCAVCAFPDRFVSTGTRSQILERAGLSPADIAEAAMSVLGAGHSSGNGQGNAFPPEGNDAPGTGGKA